MPLTLTFGFILTFIASQHNKFALFPRMLLDSKKQGREALPCPRGVLHFIVCLHGEE